MEVKSNVVHHCRLLLFASLPLLITPVQARILPAVSAGDNKLSMIIRQVIGRPNPSPPPAPSGSPSPIPKQHIQPCDSADSNYQIKSGSSSPEDQSSSCRKAIKPSTPPSPRRRPPTHPILVRITTPPLPLPSIQPIIPTHPMMI